ncbi:MAG: hypothetical protein H6626_06030 [Pseudobdellovibrionaceae bacterium]|nr:hypothetical protein [Bdellovibrionales bacterium]USN48649.1 MAG: hypothetical protein H6626_06030 [Pseudobdellovibrionaceae bacterium]
MSRKTWKDIQNQPVSETHRQTVFSAAELELQSLRQPHKSPGSWLFALGALTTALFAFGGYQLLLQNTDSDAPEALTMVLNEDFSLLAQMELLEDLEVLEELDELDKEASL